MVHLILSALILLQAPPPDKPVQAVHLPEIQSPDPTLSPGVVNTLPDGQLYVIDSDVECIVLSSPGTGLAIKAAKGPINVYATFWDSKTPGKAEVREYSRPFIYIVSAGQAGIAELLVVPSGAKTPEDVQRRTLNVQVVPPTPPVPPGPGPVPPPSPDGTPSWPSTIPIHVTYVYDRSAMNKGDAAGLTMATIRNDKATQDFIRSNNGTWFTIDTTDPAIYTDSWKSYVAAQGGPPLLVISANGIPKAYPVKSPTSASIQAVITQIRGAK